MIAIIGVLIGLLLPAVQTARESARRAVCVNNFKQLGLANHSHLEAKRVFPPGGRGYGFSTSAPTATYVADATISNMNGMVYLLPGLEQADLFAGFNLDAAFGNYNPASGKPLASPDAVASGNAALTATLIPTLLCPSDTGSRFIPRGAGTGGNLVPDAAKPGTVTPSRTSYEFVSQFNDFRYYNQWRVMPQRNRYMFGENSAATPAMVVDGLSKTLLMGERTLATIAGDYTGNWAYRGYLQVGVDPVGTYCTASVPKKGLNIWVNGTNVQPRVGVRACWYSVASLHPTGCNFVFADGSVRFLKETIDEVTLGYLCTIADGTSVSDY